MAQDDKKLKRRVRSSYLISTVSIAMVLFLLGSVSYLILNALNVTNTLRESVTILVMLDDDLGEGRVAELKKEIESKEVVKQVVFVTKDEAARQFIAETGEDFTGFIEVNPLADNFEVGLNARSAEKDAVRAFEKEVLAMQGVKEVEYHRSVIEQIGSNINKFNLILLLFGGTLLVISLILLNNTIRMTIVAKRQVINTMKLVGATKGFIMRPFIGSAVLHGIYAGLIATLMFGAMIAGLQEGLPEIHLLRSNMLLLSITGGMIVGGVVISLLFTIFAVDKFVRMTGSKIYLY